MNPRPALALTVTLAGQTLGSLCLASAAVLAPAVAPLLGHRPESVGLFVGIAYLSAMLFGLASGTGIARFGTVGLTQLAMAVLAVAMAAVTLTSQPTLAHSAFLLLVAILIGSAYGVLNPSAALLLNRHTPANHRALFFSIKQAGVPIGVALAGILMPLGLALWNWQTTAWLTAALCLLATLAMIAARRPLEPERLAERLAVQAGVATGTTVRGTGLARVMRSPALRRLVLASFAFALAQLSFVTFLVSYLNLGLGYSLAAAAAILAASQVVSTVSRVIWGAVADRWIPPGRLLGLLGVAAGVTMALLGGANRLGGVDASAGAALITALAIGTAMTAMSWNGVYIAALAQRCHHSELASVTGASQFVTFFGGTIGPITIAALVRAGMSYGDVYLLTAALPALAGIAMLREAPRPATTP